MGDKANQAAKQLAHSSDAQRREALLAFADGLHTKQAMILAANSQDLANAQDLSDNLRDRLMMNPQRLARTIEDLKTLATLPDPLGKILAEWERPNGLVIQRVSVPLGVIAVIYESRPNVTVDAAALCLKSGNAVILRSGSECLGTAMAIIDVLQHALEQVRLPPECIQLVPSTDRDAVGYLLSDMAHLINVLIPRGGKSLVERVKRDARVAVIGHLDGNCHIYIDASAKTEMAINVVLNAKLRRPSVCGALESILIHRNQLQTLTPTLVNTLLSAGCEVRGDSYIQALDSRVVPANELDWSAEYLDRIVSIKVVGSVSDAILHINRYGSHHTDSIISEDHQVVQRFFSEIESAIVMHNTSTQFADGGEFGFGAEIGISTDRLHARGPVGIEQLTSYQYRVHGHGQIRPL